MNDTLKRRQILDDLARIGWPGGSANSACAALRNAGIGHARAAVLAAVRSGEPVEYSREWAKEVRAQQREISRLEAELAAARRRLQAIERVT